MSMMKVLTDSNFPRKVLIDEGHAESLGVGYDANGYKGDIYDIDPDPLGVHEGDPERKLITSSCIIDYRPYGYDLVDIYPKENIKFEEILDKRTRLEPGECPEEKLGAEFMGQYYRGRVDRYIGVLGRDKTIDTREGTQHFQKGARIAFDPEGNPYGISEDQFSKMQKSENEEEIDQNLKESVKDADLSDLEELQYYHRPAGQVVNVYKVKGEVDIVGPRTNTLDGDKHVLIELDPNDRYPMIQNMFQREFVETDLGVEQTPNEEIDLGDVVLDSNFNQSSEKIMGGLATGTTVAASGISKATGYGGIALNAADSAIAFATGGVYRGSGSPGQVAINRDKEYQMNLKPDPYFNTFKGSPPIQAKKSPVNADTLSGPKSVYTSAKIKDTLVNGSDEDIARCFVFAEKDNMKKVLTDSKESPLGNVLSSGDMDEKEINKKSVFMRRMAEELNVEDDLEETLSVSNQGEYKKMRRRDIRKNFTYSAGFDKTIHDYIETCDFKEEAKNFTGYKGSEKAYEEELGDKLKDAVLSDKRGTIVEKAISPTQDANDVSKEGVVL